MIRQISLIGLVLGVTASLGAGCLDNNRSVSIVGPVTPSEDCEYSADPDAYFAQGLLDLAHPYFREEPNYVMYLHVINNMLSSSDPDNMEIESMAVQLEQADVSYKWLYGRDLIGGSYPALLGLEDQDIPPIYMTLLVGPSGESAGDLENNAVVGLEVIPREIGSLLTELESDAANAVLGVKVRLKGTTVGGIEIKTGYFTFPVYLCWGCQALRQVGDNLVYTCCTGQEDEYYPACRPGQDNLNQGMLPCNCKEEETP